MKALRLLFFIILVVFIFWVVFYSSFFGNNSNVYLLRSSYYSFTNKFTKPQVEDEVVGGIRFVGIKDGFYQYVYSGKFSHFDIDNETIYLTGPNNKFYGFRLPVKVVFENQKTKFVEFIQLDEFGVTKSDSSGEPIRGFESLDSDQWIGNDVRIYWNDLRKIKEILALSRSSNGILVNDSMVIAEIIRSVPRVKR